jgi:hypothetical protein
MQLKERKNLCMYLSLVHCSNVSVPRGMLTFISGYIITYRQSLDCMNAEA